ncbi:unnamed protein product [Dracunculus medinensis]|uniref:LSDAT_euk domain-containing protein n=1 Tax=Dracunculus medinensis TaxID=318479 RepID=A0A3P7QK47_DRAME|nr:unnamed protein product [Dracunculus medinensis]
MQHNIWIEQIFKKRDCAKFIASVKYPQKRSYKIHDEKWSIRKHTSLFPTDAYGTIEFQGGPHPHKAYFLRLSYDTDPAHIMDLFEKIWEMPPPKLIITVHGGTTNFNLQPKLARIIRKGLLKAATTTGAWIITSGSIFVSLQRNDNCFKHRSKVVCLGIVPWGILKKKEDLFGQVQPVFFSIKKLFFNFYFSRYGADLILRKRLEAYIKIGDGSRSVPVVCLVVEGGTRTVRAVHDYVTNNPKVPIVVCDGSGRAADLLAFTHQYIQEDGKLPDLIKPQLLNLIESVFACNKQTAEKLLRELTLCAAQKHLITVFRLGESEKHDVDHAILTALLKGQNLSPSDQLALALAWNRVDIARSDIFVLGQEWPKSALHNAMMDALINDRVDFVRLLLENGVSMNKFLTIGRLEELYNTDKGPSNTLYYIVRDVVKIRPGYRYRIPHIGLAVEKLMGNAYKSRYKEELKVKFLFTSLGNAPSSFNGLKETVITIDNVDKQREDDFTYPFNELLIWAVLTKRQEMALCMWQHGEEALAKALVACRLYKSMAEEAAEDYLEVEICEELRKYAEIFYYREFRKLSLSLLEHCYQNDDAQTLKLLTYELSNWGKETCLSLAVIVRNKQFFAHPCCQILLADLWHGGLRIRSHSNLKVLCGLLCPFYIFLLEFKSREELMLQPQTVAEHEDDINYSSSSSSSSSASDSSSDSDYSSDEASHQFQVNCNIISSIIFRSLILFSMAFIGFNGFICDTEEFTFYLGFQRPIKLRRKLYEFFVAPITTFWAWTLSYVVFLCFNTYCLLVKTPASPSYAELFCFLYILTCSCEYFRKVRSNLFYYSSKYFFSNVWNIIATIAIITYFIGFTLRCFPITAASGRIILSCNSVLWNIKLLDFLSVHPRMGPYITMAGKMIQNMAYMIVLLFVSLLAFGLARQSITYPNEEWNWILLRNVFYKPYFMLYGEVYADEIDTCGDEAWDKHLELETPISVLYNGSYATNCVPGYWLPPLLMTFFLLVANILLMSMLLAVFNNIFSQTDYMSKEIWLFERYRQVMEYESTPFLPPPFTPIYYIWMFIKYIKKKVSRFIKNILELFLDPDQVEKLHDFEEDCMESLACEKEFLKNISVEERIHRTAERFF